MGTTGAGRVADSPMQAVVRIAVEDLTAHLGTLEAELSGGRAIELMHGERVIAELRAPPVSVLEAVVSTRPDFMGRMREVFGDKVFATGTSLKWIQEERNDRDLLS